MILRNALSYDEEIADNIYKCSQCGFCKDWCQGGWDFASSIKAARFDLVARGVIPEKVMDLKNGLIDNGNVYGAKKGEIDSKLYNMIMELPEKGEKLILFGGTVLYRAPEIGISIMQLLDKVEERPASIKNETTGVFELYNLGFLSEAKEKLSSLLEQIRNSGCKEIIVLSPEDYYLLTEELKNIGCDLKDVQVFHVTQYILRLIKNGKLVIKKEFNRTVTYHDPDYLCRYSKIIDEPRELLNYIPGVKIKEMLWTKNEAHSLGSASMKFLYPDIHEAVVKMRIKDIEETDSHILITSSGDDKWNLLRNNYRPSALQVIDIVELINDLT